MRSRLAHSVLILSVFAVLMIGFAENASAIAGLEGTLEFALDAPWRIEPVRKADGTIEYGAIPIQITIQDAWHAQFDDAVYGVRQGGVILPGKLPRAILTTGRFQLVRVRELSPNAMPAQNFPLSSLYEIEVGGDWRFPAKPGDPIPGPPAHTICRIWNGENPERCRDVSQSSEWHTTLWYPPRNRTPGTTVTLEIEVLLSRDPWPPQVSPALARLLPAIGPNSFITLRNYVRVLLAPEPLPRFDNRWLYGDFHYHSQGTDNEGESGYNYRGVIRAMGAMGLDFVFATDHASSSDQLADIDLHIDLVGEGLADWLNDAPIVGPVLGPIVGDSDDTLEEDDATTRIGFLRDMSAGRFKYSHELIYGTAGANREASFRTVGLPQNYQSYGVVPQIFLGGEVDAIPEVRHSVIGDLPPEKPPEGVSFLEWIVQRVKWRPGILRYGNGLKFDLSHVRDGGVENMAQLFDRQGDLYLIRDFQGLSTYNLYGREHLIYFPGSSVLETDQNDTTFIGSFTSKYGGATRRLDRSRGDHVALLTEIERKGVAFVAHHLNACGTCSKGPDGVPWTTDLMLLKAFRSPAILGLEFWNEDARYHSKICSHIFCRGKVGFGGQELGYERAENPSILGYVPPELQDVALPLAEYRHGFLRPGRTEGGVFALIPFDVKNGTWQSRSDETEHTLHHGAHDWDVMNLRGLDIAGNAELSWLAPRTPRRMFMGGGSDAHGDLNYRRAGYLLGTDDVNDTAIGKPRNLVFAGAPEGPVIFRDKGVFQKDRALPAVPGFKPPTGAIVVGHTIRVHTQEQIIRALRFGRYSVTDGPALRIAIDVNRNGRIDDADAQMGDNFSLDTLNHEPLPKRMRAATLLVEVLSTPEFGRIARVDVYVGVHPGNALPGPGIAPEARVYAPLFHGVRGGADPGGGSLGFHQKLDDGYWQDDRLRFSPPSGSELRFTIATVLDLDSFTAGTGVFADRFFVRAFAATTGDPAAFKPDRYAFSNPIWLHRKPVELGTIFKPITGPQP